MNQHLRGWRRASPLITHTLPPNQERESLFQAARLAGRALELPSGARFILDQLCSAYRGEPVEDRILVWPSNSFLCEKTGLCERSIRAGLAHLIRAGVIQAKDSPNGKRYAQRGIDGRVVCAYGFDLSPLLARESEFRDMVLAREEARRERDRAFDEITVHRRCVESALAVLPEARSGRYSAAYAELVTQTPRRSGRASPFSSRDLWRKLRAEVDQEMIDTASGGSSCRHKDTNTKASEDSCSKGDEQLVGEAEVILETCSDAMELLGPMRSESDLLTTAEKMRGYLGISRSAWLEAVERQGPLMASLVLVYCVQVQARPAPGARQIENLGGYFRTICRLLAEGKLDFAAEVGKLRRRLT